MARKHVTSRKTTGKKKPGEHGKRDLVNDPRNQAGQFARAHHDPVESAAAAMERLKQQSDGPCTDQIVRAGMEYVAPGFELDDSEADEMLPAGD